MSVRIEEWSICNPSAYDAPELSMPYLRGKVYGHPRFNEGKLISTTEIIAVRKDVVVTRSGTKYDLGEPHAMYENRFPGAKKRLLSQEQKTEGKYSA